jgi:hypothetical protein
MSVTLPSSRDLARWALTAPWMPYVNTILPKELWQATTYHAAPLAAPRVLTVASAWSWACTAAGAVGPAQ